MSFLPFAGVCYCHRSFLLYLTSQVCPEYIQRDIVTLLPELVDDSMHEVRWLHVLRELFTVMPSYPRDVFVFLNLELIP